ncbi:protein DDC8 homolog [Acomys russatus]|uniref:protein DDC8 homolog n=1 Tax=Acomys russatus TaxID=60746 RepID=UPI0021E26694|nr:protein DDC8 homolog [Acomys russatus]
MEREPERAAQPSPSSDEEALDLRQKPVLAEDELEGSVNLQQWKAQQLQRLAEELKAEWQEARLQQVRDMGRLYLTHLLDEATGLPVGSDLDVGEYNQRGTTRHVRAKERNRAAFREEKGRREEYPRQHPKSRKKATCSERQGSTKARGPNFSEKGKGRRMPSSKSNSGCQPLGPRAGRVADLARLSPLLTSAEEAECMEEVQKATGWERRRPIGSGAPRFAQSISQGSSRGRRRRQDKTADLDQPPSPTFKQEATPQWAPRKYSGKNQWHKEIESAFEELFNTNRKLKKHLDLHLDQRLKADWNPDEQQSCLETQDENENSRREESAEAEETEAACEDESGSPAEVEAHESWSKTNLKQLLSEDECPGHYQQLAKHPSKKESLMPAPVAGASSEQDDSSESPESGKEPPKVATEEEEEQVDSVASWMALRQKQKAELEQRRQKMLLGQTEHPDMSLEIHYKAELEEERRERRRMRLAILKAYNTGFQPPSTVQNTPLDSGLLDEEKQSQMIRNLQQQILEQNKLHKQFLEKARKRLEEFQKTF